MRYQPLRKKMRLSDYDYAQDGVYFITFCVKDRHALLGKIDVGTTALGRPQVELTTIGDCVRETIENANGGNVRIDNYVIMPNHVHMIIMLGYVADEQGRSSLQQVVKNIKSYVTKQVGFPLWQHRFHDRIIRNEDEHRKISDYIDENHDKWDKDIYYKRG